MPVHSPAALFGNPAQNESHLVQKMLDSYPLSAAQIQHAQNRAATWIQTLRKTPIHFLALETLMHEYPISSAEGLALMQLAESVLRIPDATTADALIRDKLQHHNWRAHTQPDSSLLGKASGWGARIAEHIITPHFASNTLLQSMLHRLGEPVVRHAVQQAIQQLGHQFVLGKTIEEALHRSSRRANSLERYSFDMLGEGARTTANAQHYFDAYRHAIQFLGEQREGESSERGASISIKLSALHPRYELTQTTRVIDELYPRLLILAQEAKYYGMGLTLDAEESERLELSVKLIERLLTEPTLRAWNGLGMAIQAYGKRILPLVDHLIHLAQQHHERLCIRLVKGAYWDSEIKRAQELGLEDYPVFTHKAHTDLSYLIAAQKLLQARETIFTQFATHNALTIAQIIELAGDTLGFEFQRLYGMGERLYPLVMKDYAVPCRIYAPVGTYSDLLAYLVRRMLENGANTSFVHQLSDPTLSIETLCRDSKEWITKHASSPHSTDLPLPPQLYGPERQNAKSIDLSYSDALNQCVDAIHNFSSPIIASSLIDGLPTGDVDQTIVSPANTQHTLGTARFIEQKEPIYRAFEIAAQHQAAWDATPVHLRARYIERTADLLETHRDTLLSLLVKEAGKTLPDALNELREAVDFCRYYALQAKTLFDSQGQLLHGPTGESNQLILHGRGVWLCISPWNFPLAIFLGQVVAALVSGNTVVAKPAEQTPLIAHAACQLLFEAGIPHGVLQLVLGVGRTLGESLLSVPILSGIAFTGSTATARWLNQKLAAREGPILPLIAETGGQNAMIVDATALLEHSCDAIITSAFRSAGQRCSALRILWIQEDIAEALIKMLIGAMKELRIGSPLDPATDIGPVIDATARQRLEMHLQRMKQEATILYHSPLSEETTQGHFVAPHLIELRSADQLSEEVFGPILHIIRYRADEWPTLLDTIHRSGYGLTLGLHSRIDARIQHIASHAHIGNIYVNRSMIGAVVGVQPFGGEGLSGTGPKAGGPHYLPRFACERTISINLTTSGGNVALMSQTE